MKIILLADDAIRLVPEPGPMTIEARSFASRTWSTVDHTLCHVPIVPHSESTDNKQEQCS